MQGALLGADPPELTVRGEAAPEGGPIGANVGVEVAADDQRS